MLANRVWCAKGRG
ncbi:mCG12140, isoform CRA_b [Mus musculus]|nr:mCG12140, isoform CRA_b [Mus musculus]